MSVTTETIQRLEGFFIAMMAATVFVLGGNDWWWLLAIFLLFDISMVGYLTKNPKVGAFIYNLGHSYIIPIGLVVAWFLTGYVHYWLIFVALCWLFHIGTDRALGFGLKRVTGFKHTHLGEIGR